MVTQVIIVPEYGRWVGRVFLGRVPPDSGTLLQHLVLDTYIKRYEVIPDADNPLATYTFSKPEEAAYALNVLSDYKVLGAVINGRFQPLD